MRKILLIVAVLALNLSSAVSAKGHSKKARKSSRICKKIEGSPNITVCADSVAAEPSLSEEQIEAVTEMAEKLTELLYRKQAKKRYAMMGGESSYEAGAETDGPDDSYQDCHSCVIDKGNSTECDVPACCGSRADTMNEYCYNTPDGAFDSTCQDANYSSGSSAESGATSPPSSNENYSM